MVARLLVLFAVVAGFMATDALAAARCEKLIATGSADYPPFLWRDPANPRVLMGADADLLKQIGQELGLKIEILYSGSRAQAQEDVRTGRADLLIAARLTLAQLEQMDYINPPIRQTLTHVWMHPQRPFPFAGWDDLLGRSAQSSSHTALSAEFDSFARQNLAVERSPTLEAAFEQLQQGKVEFVLAARYPGQAVAEQKGISSELTLTVPAVSGAGLYLALSHNSACNDAQLRGQLTRKMTELVGSGVPETLLQRNVQLWQSQQVPAVGTQKN